MDSQFISELARRLADSLPEDARHLRSDLEKNFQALLNTAFDRMDLVTREEFDVQRKVLERTREKLGRLEAELARLEDGETPAGSG